MAAKKKPDKAKNMGTSQAAIRRMWKVIPTSEWLGLFQEIAPANRWEMVGQGMIKASCPYHNDGTASFNLSFNKRMGKCFGSTCEKLVTDLVALVAKLRNSSYTEALIFLNDRFSLSTKLDTNTDELNKYNNIQELKKEVAMAANKVLIELIRDAPSHLEYCRPALVYLTEVRALPLEALSNLPVGVFAKPMHLLKYVPETLHALFDEYFKKYNNNACYGALIFHYNDSPGTITRFKLRLRDHDLPSTTGVVTRDSVEKLSIGDKTRLYKKEYAYIEDPYTERLGVYGLHKFHRMLGQNDSDAYITEGEFDVLAVMAAQDTQNNSEFIIVGTGGKGTTSVGFLREFGIRSGWLIPDHPAKNGDQWAISLLGDRSNFVVDGDYNRPIDFKVFQWPVSVTGMDLDEAVRRSGYPLMVDVLFKQRLVNFKNSLRWIKSKADAELKGIKTSYDSRIQALDPADEDIANLRETLVDEKRKLLYDTLVKWYRYLHDQSDRLAFTQEYEASEGIDLSLIEDIHGQVNGMDTENGVHDALVGALEEYFSVAYYEGKGTAFTATLWSKTRNESFDIVGDANKLFSAMALYLGTPVTRWMDKFLGNNKMYTEGVDDEHLMRNSRIRRSNAESLLRSAFELMTAKLISKDELSAKAQGIHFLDLPDVIRNAGIMYVVNGKRVFKGQFTDEPGQVEWEKLNAMMDKVEDKGVLFTDLSEGSKWSHIEDISDLYAASKVDLPKLFTDIRTVLRGWCFEHQEVVEPYLAAYIMSLAIQCAVGNINITLVTGDKESGKTSLVDGLLGGTMKSSPGAVPALVESAKSMSDATSAALYQSFDETTLAFVLDEAEQSTDHNTEKDKRNVELTRYMFGMPMGTQSIHRGGQTKDQKVKYNVRIPVIMAAINIPTDSTFLSRVMVIYTSKKKDHQNILNYIADRFTDQQIVDMRKACTVALLPRIPEIMKIRERLRKDLPAVGRSVAMTSNRFIESVLTPLAVYDLMGFDAAELYKNILACYKHRLEAIHGQDSNNTLISTCLYREKIKVASEDVGSDFVSAKTLILKSEYNLLNSSDCGVYYLTSNDWIVIVWRQVKYTILQGTPYERMEESSMKEQAAKNPYVVQEVSPEQHAHIQYYLRLSDVQGPSDYTAIRHGYLMKAMFRTGEGPKDNAPTAIDVEFRNVEDPTAPALNTPAPDVAPAPAQEAPVVPPAATTSTPVLTVAPEASNVPDKLPGTGGTIFGI